MADFEAAYRVVMVTEGGYANDPDDRGGETYKGIARNFFPKWEGWRYVDAVKVGRPINLDATLQNNISLQRAVHSFYKNNFWDELSLDKVNDQSISIELFDTGVNMGVGIAALFLQQTLNVTNRNGLDYPDLKEDARIGPITISYVNKHQRPKDVLKVLNCLQGARYVDICRSNPKQEKFMRSWFSRVSL